VSDFEDLRVGEELRGGSRTVTDAEIALLPAIMGATNALFHDEVAAQAGPIGRRILYGPALLGIGIALTEPLFRESAMGLLGIDGLRFETPVGSGDTVTAFAEVTELRPRPGKPGGIVKLADRLENQKGEVVARFERTIMLRQRAAEEESKG
jgi:acyl dehydratase